MGGLGFKVQGSRFKGQAGQEISVQKRKRYTTAPSTPANSDEKPEGKYIRKRCSIVEVAGRSMRLGQGRKRAMIL